jgi:hypothetical protein
MTAPYWAKSKTIAKAKARKLRKRGLRSGIFKRKSGWGITSKRRTATRRK